MQMTSGHMRHDRVNAPRVIMTPFDADNNGACRKYMRHMQTAPNELHSSFSQCHRITANDSAMDARE